MIFSSSSKPTEASKTSTASLASLSCWISEWVSSRGGKFLEALDLLELVGVDHGRLESRSNRLEVVIVAFGGQDRRMAEPAPDVVEGVSPTARRIR